MKGNDNKKRSEHEFGTAKKAVYQDVAARNNDVDDDDSIAAIVDMDDDDHFEEFDDLDLNQFESQTSSSVASKVKELMKVRRKMKEDMELSGTHDSDPFNFVQNGLQEVSNDLNN